MRSSVILSALLILTACGGGSSSADGDSDDPLPRGGRMLSIDLSAPEDAAGDGTGSVSGDDYTAVFEQAYLTDMDQVKLSFDWDNLAADMSVTGAIDSFYPAYDMPLVVFIRPIHIHLDERPAALQSEAFDSTTVVTAFETLIDDFLAATPNATYDAIIVGSEIDFYLGSDTAAWAAYTTFFQQVAAHIRSARPGTLVGSEVTFNAYQDPTQLTLWNLLCAHADFVGVSYYGIEDDYAAKAPSTVAGDFRTIVEGSVDKPIWFPQLGYPAATSLGSSEVQQAAWIEAVFEAWDTHRADIRMINFTWLHDWSPTEVEDYMTGTLGIDPSTTLLDDFLGSLGYRTWDDAGSDKAAWPALKSAAAARGWQRDPADIPTPFSKPIPQ